MGRLSPNGDAQPQGGCAAPRWDAQHPRGCSAPREDAQHRGGTLSTAKGCSTLPGVLNDMGDAQPQGAPGARH